MYNNNNLKKITYMWEKSENGTNGFKCKGVFFYLKVSFFLIRSVQAEFQLSFLEFH